jgi:hypothetical protein
MRDTSAAIVALALVAAALLACGGKAAVEDLEKLKDKTCSCKEDKACIDEAKAMAKQWVEKHKNARGGDQEKAGKLAEEIASCSLEVGLELAKAAEAE